jgi:integrase
MSRANGEGSIYDTIQKIKKKFDNSNMCKICSECTNRSYCNDRTGYIKCDKCLNCTSKDCDRFYIYKKSFAQISTAEGRKTVGIGKTKKEASNKKALEEEKIEKQKNIKEGNSSLLDTMKKNNKEKHELKLITDNTYLRNNDTIKSIEKHPMSYKNMLDLTEDNIKELMSYFVSINTSQSQLEKIYDQVTGAFKYCKLDTISNIKRTTFVSNKDIKEVTAFTVEEERILLEYINKNENSLVDFRSKIDSKTVKNLIKFNLATAMRIGEICALNRDTDIDRINKKVLVNKTITKDINGKSIVGTQTKTGRKTKQAKKKDIRYIPFSVLFDENEFTDILNDQYIISSSNPYNSSNLLFCTKEGKLITHSAFNNIFKRICRSAGIKLEIPEGCNTHMMKHTGVTRMIENDIRIDVISKIVGTSVEVLRKTYAHILDDFIENEIKKSIQNRKNKLSLH